MVKDRDKYEEFQQEIDEIKIKQEQEFIYQRMAKLSSPSQALF